MLSSAHNPRVPRRPSGGGGRGAVNPAVLELIPDRKSFSFRWHQYDYPAAIARWNHHPEYELHLITCGTGRAMIGDYIGPFKAGQLVLVGPDLPHAWFSPLAEGEVLKGRDVVLQFSQSWIEGLIALCPELAGLTRLLADARYGVEFTGAQALANGLALRNLGGPVGESMGEQPCTPNGSTDDTMERAAADSGARLAGCIALMARLAASPWRRLSGNCQKMRDPLAQGGSGAVRINQLVRALLSADPATLRHEDIAASLGMTASGFSRQFRAVTGETFMSFVQRLRIDHACHLLSTTHDAITVVCLKAGFGNLSNFNRVFLSLRGCTPRQFRHHSHQITAPCFSGCHKVPLTEGSTLS
ncbi:helix-turn-helix domain-containing protein [Asaia sp. As-1742]|uniref:AraC family transcriptional regulator n=1 Tax=Asaia sp. As-1742 TaxID=2608325 RepID=UPI0014204673|nr:AraC family transcriptional regulator [Asaia sp. As-1742]